MLVMIDSQGDVSIFNITPGSDTENQVIADVRTGSGAKVATVNPDGTLLFIVLEEGDAIEIYSLDIGTSVSVFGPDATGQPVTLTLVATIYAGENPQDIAFHPETGEFIVTNAGDNTVTVFGEFTEGAVLGSVYADCPEPGTGLYGVEIDVFERGEGTGDLVSVLETDSAGYYESVLAVGDYTLLLVTPLGYTIDPEEVPLTIVGGDPLIVDWPLTCEEIVPKPRKMSFWKHQLGVAIRGHGWAQIDGPTLCEYLDMIESHFNNHRLNQVVVYIPPPEPAECIDKLQAAKDLLNLDGDLDMLAHAKQELMALLLNVASEKLALSEVISEDGAKVSQAITYVDYLIDDGDPVNDETAMKIAKDINKGKPVRMGVIPEDIPDISYLPRPLRFALDQNYPNPFNPKATIKFEIAKPVHVKLKIYDIAGRLVRTLVDEPRKPNSYRVVWDGKNQRGGSVASGVYFCRLEAGTYVATRKMMLLK
jgi:hypothetical protein